jgi:hypothetical protein
MRIESNFLNFLKKSCQFKVTVFRTSIGATALIEGCFEGGTNTNHNNCYTKPPKLCNFCGIYVLLKSYSALIIRRRRLRVGHLRHLIKDHSISLRKLCNKRSTVKTS